MSVQAHRCHAESAARLRIVIWSDRPSRTAWAAASMTWSLEMLPHAARSFGRDLLRLVCLRTAMKTIPKNVYVYAQRVLYARRLASNKEVSSRTQWRRCLSRTSNGPDSTKIYRRRDLNDGNTTDRSGDGCLRRRRPGNISCVRSAGYDVALVAEGGGLEAAAKEVESDGARALVIGADVSEFKEVDAAATLVENELGPIDVWIDER